MKSEVIKKIKIKKLKYIDPLEALKRLQNYNELVFFDSASKSQKNNRYSYIALDPIHSYKINQRCKKSIFDKKTEIEIKKIFKKLSFQKKSGYPSFQCGLAGYISYDHCLSIEEIDPINKDIALESNLYLGMFDIVIAFDLKIKRSYVFSYDLDYYFKKKITLLIK